MVYTDNHLITLNSKYANKLNGTMLSNVVFGFTGLLQDENNIINTYITVSNAQIPASFYTITSLNNTMIYIENGSSFSFNIPVGNYNSTSLISALLTGFGSVVTITINKINGKLTLIFNTNTIILKTSSIGSILGFVDNVNCYTLVAVELQYPLNLFGVKKISIKSDALAITSYSSVNFSTSNTLTTIPVDQPPFNLINYLNQATINTNILQARTLNTIDISMVDENNNYIDFNNCDWSLTLVLTINRNIDITHNTDLSKTISNKLPTIESLPEVQVEKNQHEKDLELLLK